MFDVYNAYYLKSQDFREDELKYLICGFSGAGKTTKLSELESSTDFSNYDFKDLDGHIFNNYKSSHESLGQLIEDKGWEWFRSIEKKTLLKLIKNKNIWISLGGGTLTEDICDVLRYKEDLKIFWLDTPFEICWERIKNDKNRPLVLLGKEKMLELYRKRCLVYKNYPKFKD